MERFSDTAIDIINSLHTERLDYNSEYIPLIDAANRLKEYEDVGLEPEEIINRLAAAKEATIMALIKTDDFLEKLGWADADVCEAYGDDSGLWGFTLDNIKGVLSKVPKINPVHYAGGCYCRECRFRTDSNNCRHPRYEILPTVYPNDFCSYGRRRDGGE